MALPVSHEDYAKKTAHYRGTRVPIGSDKVKDFILKGGSGSGKCLRLLEAGCGTGNYLRAFAKSDKEIQFHGLDASKDMLEEARANVASLPAKGQQSFKFQHGNLCDPEAFKPARFVGAETAGDVGGATSGVTADEQFDGLWCCQVLHHLGNVDVENSNLETTLRNFYDSLAPNGRVAINYSPPDIHAQGIWWVHLMPSANKAFHERSPSIEQITSIMEKIGFQDVKVDILYEDNLYQADAYGDAETFIQEDVPESENPFYQMDSTFAMATEQERQDAKAFVKGLVKEGKWQEWFQAQEAQRKASGQSVNVYAVKK